MAGMTPAREQAAPQAVPAAVVPFVNASHEFTEPFYDSTFTLSTSQTQVGPVNVPANGYLGKIFIQVDMIGGTIGSGTLSADYPYNVLQNITLSDVNGAPIYGPIDGYAALWTNIINAGAFRSDPRQNPDYSATLTNTRFSLRIPVEISHHDGLGCLANQNSAAAYQINFALNTLANLYPVLPTAAPQVRVRMLLEGWTLPNETDRAGRPQAQMPPAHGTTMFHSQFQKPVVNGANTIQLVRMGNMIRYLLIIARNASNVRADNVFPDPVVFSWDARQILNDTQWYRKQITWERIPSVATMDAGVFVYAFNHSSENKVGDDSPTLWLSTVQATRMEFQGSSAAAGNLQIVTCDVAPAEVQPSERYVETSNTGFSPQVGATIANVQ